MPATPAIDVVSDANVALKWFHSEGEEEVEPARALLAGQRERTVALHILDLTPYEVGNALLRGRLGVPAARVGAVLDALREICPTIAPSSDDFGEAAALAEEHQVTSTTPPTPPSHAVAAHSSSRWTASCCAPHWDDDRATWQRS